MIQAIHHAQITVPPDRVDEARDFYIDVLQLNEIPKPEALVSRGGFWLGIGEQQLHIGIEDGISRAATKAHIAFQVQYLDEWKSRLAGADIEIKESIPIPGYERFEFRDPFGNRMELIEKSP